jgi:redox-sensing transcriptional repressor
MPAQFVFSWNMKRDAVPDPVTRRLTRYLLYVQENRERIGPWISSETLAAVLGLTDSTVRQDLWYLELAGTPRRGYPVDRLQRALAEKLNLLSGRRVMIVGAGNAGRALTRHKEFARRGFQVRAVVDSDDTVVGTHLDSLVVEPLKKIASIVKRRKIDIGIIAVPASAAQEVADTMVSVGIKGILNFSAAHVTTPANVPLVDVRVVASLMELSGRLP